MSRRLPYDDTSQSAVWNEKHAVRDNRFREVLIAHADPAIGESLCLLLRIKGFMTVQARDLECTTVLLSYWRPHALVLDTRLVKGAGVEIIQGLANEAGCSSMFLIAMSNVWPEESVSQLKVEGFDAFCRRPCPVWKLADMLNGYFDRTV